MAERALRVRLLVEVLVFEFSGLRAGDILVMLLVLAMAVTETALLADWLGGLTLGWKVVLVGGPVAFVVWLVRARKVCVVMDGRELRIEWRRLGSVRHSPPIAWESITDLQPTAGWSVRLEADCGTYRRDRLPGVTVATADRVYEIRLRQEHAEWLLKELQRRIANAATGRGALRASS